MNRLQRAGMQHRVAPMLDLGADENEGSDPVGRDDCYFERARASDRAADDNQAIAFRHAQGYGRPCFDAVTKRVKRWRMG